MILVLPHNPWRKRFAFLPFTIPHGPTKAIVWLEPYWVRSGGNFREVTLADPARTPPPADAREHSSPPSSERARSRDDQNQAPDAALQGDERGEG